MLREIEDWEVGPYLDELLSWLFQSLTTGNFSISFLCHFGHIFLSFLSGFSASQVKEGNGYILQVDTFD